MHFLIALDELKEILPYAVKYNADGKGTHVLYASVEKAIRTVRASEPLRKDWSEEIDADYQERG